MDFTEIAMQKLNQAAPELVNLVVAFRDISEETSAEVDISVGVFILQSGSEMFFVPVIQKDQTVHPIDSVFFASTGKFRPLAKSTVSQILNASKLEPGKAKRIPNGVTRNPSVYDLVTPPRTGKFVYASDSRITEFLAAMPNHLKSFVRTRVSEDSPLANGIHKLYGIENFLTALRDSQFENKEVMEAPAKAVLTYGDALDEAQAREVLEKGYALNDSYPHGSRVAIPQEEFSYHGQLHEISPGTEGGKCFRLLTASGNIVNAYVPNESIRVPVENDCGSGCSRPSTKARSQEGIVLTESGRILSVGRFIAVGDELVGEKDNHSVVSEILRKFTAITPITTGQELRNGRYAVILDHGMNVVLAGSVHQVSHCGDGTEVSVSGPRGTTKVCFVKGLKSAQSDASGVLCVPDNYPVISGERDHGESSKCESLSINQAQASLARQALVSLGDRLTIGHDGIDYSLNGKIVGPAHKAIEILIVNEGFEPHRAESFVKTASERRSLEVYMSKKADFSPGEIPEFGEKPQPQTEPNMDQKNIQQAVDSGDKQVSDAMILSELLQTPDLFGLISEYTPDIEEAVDRLGRILFLSRVRMNQLVQTSGSESALSTIASVKSVYRSLGDNLVKLEQLISNVSAN